MLTWKPTFARTASSDMRVPKTKPSLGGFGVGRDAGAVGPPVFEAVGESTVEVRRSTQAADRR